jgi:hypothetical protein
VNIRQIHKNLLGIENKGGFVSTLQFHGTSEENNTYTHAAEYTEG